MPQYKAILFDFWDTLAQISNLDILIEEVKNALGDDRYSIMKRHFIDWHTSDKSQEAFIKDLNKEININDHELPIIKKIIDPKHYEKFPETDEVLRLLKDSGLKIILATNAPPASKKAFDNLGLPDYFDKTVFSCDIGILKPDKQIFTYAISGFGIDPGEALMVGDSLEKDVKGAISAGLDGILIDRKGLTEYDNKISDLRELIDRTKK